MSSIKKCPKCSQWSEDQETCPHCGELLDYWKIRERDVAQKEKEEAEKPPSDFDKFIESLRHSRFILVRIIFYFFYSIWVGMIAIVSFFMYMVASAPG